MKKCMMTVDDSGKRAADGQFHAQAGGLRVVEAVDGKDALSKLDGNPVHMVITDLNMPNLDGIGLIKGVRSNAAYKFIPIIMLTTESQESKKLEGKQAGATGWT